MARRNSNTSTVEPTEADTPEATEATDTSTTEASAAAESSDTEKPAKVELTDEQIAEALTDFNTALATAVDAKDTATGELPEAQVDLVQKAYRALGDTKLRNAAKKVLKEAVNAAMTALDVQTARANMVLLDKMAAGGAVKPKTEKVPADPTEAFVEKVAVLSLAYSLTVAEVPEGVSADEWEAKVTELVNGSVESATSYREWLANESEDKGDEPDVSNVIKNAVKLSLGRSAKARAAGAVSTYTGDRRNIATHIYEAFEGQPSGTFLTVAEIRSHRSNEYGDSPPSPGAISARLFPKNGKCTLEGVVPDTNEKSHKGGRKV